MSLAPSLTRGPGLTWRGVLKSEWSKLWSLRPTPLITLGLIVVPLVAGLARVAAAPPAWQDGADGVAAALESIALGVIPLGFIAALLGLFAMGSELTGDVLTGTFIASPRRRLVVLSKCAISFSVTFAVVLASLAASAVIAGLVLQGKGHAHLPLPSMMEIVFLGALAAALLSVMGVTSAVLARTMTSAALQLAVVLAVAPALLGLIGGSSARWLTDLLPAPAVQALVTRHPAMPFTIEGAPPSGLPWISALAVLCAWVVVYCIAALIVIVHRPLLTAHRSKSIRSAEFRATVHATAGLRFSGLVKSEALKVATLSAARWLLGLSAVVFIVVALIGASRTEIVLSEPVLPGDRELAVWSTQAMLLVSGAGLAQLLLAAFGVVVISSEFTSGSIISTVLVAPQRARLFIAKGLVVTLVAGAASLAMVFATALLMALMLRQRGIEAEVGLPVLESIARCALALTLLAIVGFAIGMLLRTPLGSLAGIVTLLVLVPSALSPLQVITRGTPLVLFANIVEFFPSLPTAATVLPPDSSWPLILGGGVLQLHPNHALLVVAAWSVTSLIAAVLSFRRRGI